MIYLIDANNANNAARVGADLPNDGSLITDIAIDDDWRRFEY